jgi:predicted nuclease of predicted toxin-antitoxin system
MKLLFDENLSRSLVADLADLFPGSAHVTALLGMSPTDTSIWEMAKRDGFTIVSKDNDFRQRSFVQGAPPKVVWLAVGNAGSRQIGALIRQRTRDLNQFEQDETASLLIVKPVPTVSS